MVKKIFIISLQKSAHRREYISNLFNQNHIEFEFFDAFDGGLHIQNDFEIKFNLTNGELGCLYSHLLLYKKIQKENICEALVLEDDIIFDNRFLTFHKNCTTECCLAYFPIIPILLLLKHFQRR